MTLDRAELAGTGAALVFHLALIAAMSLSLAQVADSPEPPAMEVELVEDVALKAAAPAAAPTAAQTPETGEALPIEPTPAPKIEPTPPAPRVVPTPAPRSTEKASARPAPSRPKKPAAPPTKAPRVSRIGDDFLKGIADAPAASAPAAAAPKFSASALAGIQQAIRRQVQPCADRQSNPGTGANRIRVKLHLRLSRSGRLLRPPEVAGISGVDEENAHLEERVKDLAVATFVGCAPLSGLPPDLYKTANGQGWGDFIMNYNLP